MPINTAASPPRLHGIRVARLADTTLPAGSPAPLFDPKRYPKIHPLPPRGSRSVPKVGQTKTCTTSAALAKVASVVSADFSQICWPKLEQMNALPLQFLMLIFAGWVNRHQEGRDRISPRGKSSPAGVTRREAAPLHRSAASTARGKAQASRQKGALPNKDPGHSGYPVPMAVCSHYSSDGRDLTATLRRAAACITADWRPI